MLRFARTAEAVAATTKKTEKVRLVADFLKAVSASEAPIAALYFSGRLFPAYTETTLQVGGSILWQVVQQVSGASDAALTAAYRKHGDLGSAAHDVLGKDVLGKDALDSIPTQSRLTLIDVDKRFREIADARRAGMKVSLLADLLSRATALEAKYLIKLMAGELRIGLRESLVEEAIAQAWQADIRQVQRANVLLGDIGEALRLAAEQRLDQARMRMFHPLGFMLASPAEDAAAAFGEFQHALVEDKYDGIRAQAHVGRAPDGRWQARLFSRTLDDVTESFPELPAALAAFSDQVVLDGEVVAWSQSTGEALPFAELQRRLGRKRVTRELMALVPVRYVVFDVLYAGGELTLDKPLRERAALLDGVFASARQVAEVPVEGVQGELVLEPAVKPAHAEPAAIPQPRVLRAPAARAESPQELERLFEQAQARGNEGLMIKDLESPYTPGRRGRSWLKLKRELATLDAVVTAVEYGHGKRAGVLSDYTFAVRGPGGDLLNVGKAYSGLTDAEIAEMTQWFLRHTVEDRGFVRSVEPKIVIEVAFNAVMISDRHESGFALRFPRILRLRLDKSPEEADTLERVREIYQRQRLPQNA